MYRVEGKPLQGLVIYISILICIGVLVFFFLTWACCTSITKYETDPRRVLLRMNFIFSAAFSLIFLMIPIYFMPYEPFTLDYD